MPREYHDYQFTAFQSQALFGGGAGGVGSQFTVPSGGAVSISVRDDEANLGGDLRWNEHADDLYVSGATIRTESGQNLGNGGKIYGEEYAVVRDASGHEYRMVRVEQDDSQDAYYAFDQSYGLPEAGTHLTVVDTYNVNKWLGDMSSYHNLTVPETPDPVVDPEPQTDLGRISGRLTEDADCDDTEFAAGGGYDEGLAGQTVELYGWNGTSSYLVATTTTDANGSYEFTGLDSRWYAVQFPEIEGGEFAEKDVGVEHADSDANASGWTGWFTLDEGEVRPNVDASVKFPVQTGSIEGTVFIDEECDGLQVGETHETLGENLIRNGGFEDNNLYADAGYRINARFDGWDSSGRDSNPRVYESDYGHGNEMGNAVASLSRDAEVSQTVQVENAGAYQLSFDVLQWQSRYDEIEVSVDGRLVQIVPVYEDRTVTLDLELGAGGHVISFEGGGSNRYYGAGLDNVELREVILVGDEDEGRAGVTIALQNLDGTPVLDANGDPLTTQTDADGNYRFDDIPVGDYQIVGVAPDGTEFTLQDVGDDDAIDSDVNSDGVSGTIEVRQDQTEDVDLGLCNTDPGGDPTYPKVFFAEDLDENDFPTGGFAISAEAPDPNPFRVPALEEGVEPTFENYLGAYLDLGGDVGDLQSVIFYEAAEDGSVTEAFRIDPPEDGFRSADEVLAAYDDAIDTMEEMSPDTDTADLITLVNLDTEAEAPADDLMAMLFTPMEEENDTMPVDHTEEEAELVM